MHVFDRSVGASERHRLSQRGATSWWASAEGGGWHACMHACMLLVNGSANASEQYQGTATVHVCLTCGSAHVRVCFLWFL
jgi:hypothetical protein